SLHPIDGECFSAYRLHSTGLSGSDPNMGDVVSHTVFSSHGVADHAGDRKYRSIPYPVDQPTEGIVHDLGNLIQVATSALNRVSQDAIVSMDPGLEPVIAGARTALQRAGALVRETVSRAQERHRETEHTDVSSCLAEVDALVRSGWGPQIRLEIRLGHDLPFVKCDRLGLLNAIFNLVFNGCDAMPDGGTISIDAVAVNHRFAAHVEFRIEDRGIGMTPETVARAFDPFFTTKGKGPGGVGLSMVKRFAEQHGGSVEIQSTFGTGTAVILRLPVGWSATDATP
ncbi:sensor histidine kinase, partial [Rhizobiaceae sp. 2RAB30]